MSSCSVFTESSRIFNDVLLSDNRLGLPDAFKEAAKKVEFVGGDDKPFVLTPLKITESSAFLTALLATAANVVAAQRYGINYQDVEVNTDIATLFLESVLLPTIGGKQFLQNSKMLQELAKMDVHDMSKPIRRYATNVYQTQDGRWYHLHSSMNAELTMKMMRVENLDVSPEEAVKIYAQKVSQWNSKEIEEVANEQYEQAGVVCYTHEEFLASEQGKAMSEEPLWTSTRVSAPRKA